MVSMRFNAQSAMEYLMTYGWSILIIAIILTVLLILGIFNSSSLLGTQCIARSGYSCTYPTLNTTGYLSVNFAWFGEGYINVTGIACTSNATSPTSLQYEPNVKLQSGQLSTFVFKCPVIEHGIGSTFSGVLWIGYNTPAKSGQLVNFASLSAVESVNTSVGSIATSSTSTSTTSTIGATNSTSTTSTTGSTSTSTSSTTSTVSVWG